MRRGRISTLTHSRPLQNVGASSPVPPGDMMRPVSTTGDHQSWLEAFVRDTGGIAGTVHVVTSPDLLTLAAAVRIPPPVLQLVQTVPRGKGMAGLALERDAPVSTCNIKTDATGDVRPGARAVDARAGVALPVHDAGGKVRAVVGVAFTDEKALSESELADLAARGPHLARRADALTR